MWLALSLACRGPGTDGSDSTSGAPSDGPSATTADTGGAASELPLRPPASWGMAGWSRPQHHVQLAWSADGSTLWVAYSEGEYLPDPTVRLGTVDPATSAPVGEVYRLGGPDGLLAIKPSLAVDGRGRVDVAYQGAAGGVYEERVTPGQPATEFQVVQPPDPVLGAGNESVDLVLRPDGSSVVAWYTQSDLDETARFVTRLLGPDLALGLESVIATVPDDGPATPEVALLPDGRALLAWVDDGREKPAVLLSWLGDDGLPTSTVTAWDDGGHVSRPQLAAAPDGRVALTFPLHTEVDVSEVALMVVGAEGEARMGPVAPFGVPDSRDLSTVAWVGDDALLVAWSAPEELSGGAVYLAVVSAVDGAVLAGPQLVAGPGPILATRPALAVREGPDHPFAIAWEEYDDAGVREVRGTFGTVPERSTSR